MTFSEGGSHKRNISKLTDKLFISENMILQNARLR